MQLPYESTQTHTWPPYATPPFPVEPALAGPYAAPALAGPGEAPAPPVPSAWPVAAFTFFFGVFGAISAARRARRARALGLPTGRYWGAFAGALAVSWLLGLVFAVVLLVASAGGTGPVTDAQELASSIVQEGDFRDGAGTSSVAQDATCAEVRVAADGSGTYRCLVDFMDGSRRSYSVTVGSDGNWVTDSGN
jgi:hypothetical protein